jgi:hypothetical protein
MEATSDMSVNLEAQMNLPTPHPSTGRGSKTLARGSTSGLFHGAN